MTAGRSTSSHRWRRRLLVGIVAIFALLTGAVGSLLFVDRRVIEEQFKDWVLPHLEEQLGRPVQVKSVRMRLFPPGAELQSVTVASPAGQPPLVEVESARATFELWPLLRSGGTDVRIGTVQLERPHVNLVRGRNGRWNFQRPKPRPAASVDAAGEGPDDAEQALQFAVRRLRVRDGTLSIVNVTANVPRIVLEHIDVKGRNLSSEHPIRLDIAAALASRQQNVKGTLFARADGGGVNGTVAVDSFDVARLREVIPAGIGRVLVGGRATIKGRFDAGRGRVNLAGHVDARRLSFGARPADADFDFSVNSRPLRRTEPILRLTRVHLHGPGVKLAGDAWVGRRNRFGFDASGPLLDLDAMLPAAAAPAKAQATASRPRPGASRALRMAVGTGHLQVDRVIVHRVRAEDVVATVRIRGSEFELAQASARVYGGVLDASGSRLTMGRTHPDWHLRATLDNVDFGQVMRQVHGRSPAEGLLDARVDIHGASFAWQQLRPSLTGSGSFSLQPGASPRDGLADGVAEAPADLVQPGDAKKSKSRARIESVAGAFTLAGGALRFERPLDVHLSSGKASLLGTVGLDGRLDLRGDGLVYPKHSKLSWLKLRKPIATQLTLGGTVLAPKLHVDGGDIARAVVARAPPVKLVRVIRNLFRRH